MKRAGAAIAGLWILVTLVPAIPLALTPHRIVPRPDPSQEPKQEKIEGARPLPIRADGTLVRLTPRARYDIAARVAGRERYRAGLAGALLPWDFILTWGDVTREPIRSKIDYLQTGRFYNWSTSDASIDLGYVSSHSANVHLIPADGRIARALGRVRTGDVVRLTGDLVDADGPSGFEWRTSLTRNDTGAGACETLFVRSVTIGNRLYDGTP